MERNEAIEVIKKNWPNSSFTMLREALETVIPELKESEDEKIRKEMIEIIGNEAKEFPSSIIASKANSWIAWLEKQRKNNMGISEATKKKLEDNLNKALEKETPESWNKFLEGEQKPTDKVEPKFKVGDVMRTLQEASDGFTDGMPVVVSIDEEYYHCNNELIAIKDQDDYEYPPMNRRQKPADLPKGEDYGIDSLYHAARILEKTLGEVDGYESDDGILEHKCAIEAVNRLYKQKPAWSEEDEVGLGDAMWAIQQARTIAKDENDMGNLWCAERWLKSLKDRVQPQSKQEWSEEDDQYLLVCKNALAKYQTTDKWDASVIYRWLVKKVKSLRPQWKPNEEMLEALYRAIPKNVMEISEDEMLLDKLYQGLKYGRVLSKN